MCIRDSAKAALAGGLKPIICVGESLDQREQGEMCIRDSSYGSAAKHRDRRVHVCLTKRKMPPRATA